MFLPKGNASAARKVAMLSAAAGLLVALAGFVQFKAGETVTLADVDWIPSLGIRYHLAADGISLTLVLLTGLAAAAGVFVSWKVERRAEEGFAVCLALIGGVGWVVLGARRVLL